MATNLANLTTQQLKRALALREQIEALQSELNQLDSGKAPAAPAPSAVQPGKRVMSPQAKAKIAAAQRKRWAAAKKEKNVAAPKATPAAKPMAKVKRTMSPEAKAKIAASQKALWAKKRAEASKGKL